MLVYCLDCRRQISDAAPACPGCGRPQPPPSPLAAAPSHPWPRQSFPHENYVPKKAGITTHYVFIVGGLLFAASIVVMSAMKREPYSDQHPADSQAKSCIKDSDCPSGTCNEWKICTVSNSKPASRSSSLLANGNVKCSGSGLSSVSCGFESTGVGAAKACWDVVLECSGQRHQAHVCSGMVPSGATQSYSGDLDPPVLLEEKCTSSRIESLVMQ